MINQWAEMMDKKTKEMEVLVYFIQKLTNQNIIIGIDWNWERIMLKNFCFLSKFACIDYQILQEKKGILSKKLL